MAEPCDSVVSGAVLAEGQAKPREEPTEERPPEVKDSPGTLIIGLIPFTAFSRFLPSLFKQKSQATSGTVKSTMNLSDPILSEDSTLTKLAPSLERILSELGEGATHHDHLVALLLVLLKESGFCWSSMDTTARETAPIQEEWKCIETGIYEIRVWLKQLPEVNCKLIAIPSGDTLILNFFLMRKDKEVLSMMVQTLKYVNPYSSDAYGRYINLREISHRFKDTLATPIRSNILREAGFVSPSLQDLPVELKLKIFEMLDKSSRKRLSECSPEYCALSVLVTARNTTGHGCAEDEESWAKSNGDTGKSRPNPLRKLIFLYIFKVHFTVSLSVRGKHVR
ncbi:hypothetical protein KM043_004766 [Ampulex compressa]|nr:hypothetical protein KM043_004766 [Ampulex compressa]